MTIRVGINGLGRIGRGVLRAIFEIEEYSKQIEVVAVNGSLSAKQHAHLIKYDSVHGKFSGDIDFNESQNWISINGKKFSLYRERNPENIPWNVDVILECTGAFNKREEAIRHNAEKVIVSAPVPDADVTIVYGVNDDMLEKEHKVISAGSCTTNCLAPIVKVLLYMPTRMIKMFLMVIIKICVEQGLADYLWCQLQPGQQKQLVL